MIGRLLVLFPASGSTLFADVLPWVGLFVILILAGGGLAMLVRRSIFAGSESTVGFTLEDLREMRDRGEISDDEFEQSRDRMMNAVRNMGSPGNRPSSSDSTSRLPGATPPPRRSPQGPKSPPIDGSSPDPENG